MPERPRVLVLNGAERVAELLHPCLPGCEVVHVEKVAQALALIREQHFDAFWADPGEAALREQAGDLTRAGRLLDALADGVAVVDAGLKIIWANPAFAACCGGPVRERAFYEALGTPEILGPDYSPFHTALAGRIATTRLHCKNDRYLELNVTPMAEPGAAPTQLIVLTRDVTAEVQQQQKLDALHKAGAELAALAPDQIADMSPAERIELLKQDIRRLTHDLLHYDVIEIRLLDRATGRLEPLLEEGMTPEAAGRVLYAEPQGNGVTGFVAASGKSYLCGDAANDPLYIEGAAGAARR